MPFLIFLSVARGVIHKTFHLLMAMGVVFGVCFYPQSGFAQDTSPAKTATSQRHSILERIPTPASGSPLLTTPAKLSEQDLGGPRITHGSLPNDRRPPTNSADQVSVNHLITRLVLDNMPHHFDKEKNWGHQERRWDGVKIQRDGLKIKTHRRWKMVNDGTWRKYSVDLLNPNEEFFIELQNVRKTERGGTGFDISFTARLKLHARQSKWLKGVQLYSISADGHAKVRLMVACETDVSMDLNRFPPDLVFSPTVTTAQLSVDEFHLDRVSKLGGEFSQQIARQARKVLDEKIEEKEAKLVTKINKQLNKEKDKLRLSIADAVTSKWTGQVKSFLPKNVQDAITPNKSSNSKR